MYTLAYTIFGPVVGALMDRGFSPLKAVVFGHIIIALTYFLLGIFSLFDYEATNISIFDPRNHSVQNWTFD